jgi:predicted O-linked N-acetylglucosamine transferase (SPINDLY family)
MPTLDDALTAALQHHQAGRLRAAEHIYRQVLAVAPNQPDALHLLGLVAHQTGQHEAAIDFLGRAVAVHPSSAIYHNSLGEACRAAGRSSQAMACYRRAIELAPDYAVAHANLGDSLKSQGSLDEAIACYRRAIELKPDFAEAYNNLGAVLNDQRQPDAAMQAWRQAVTLRTDFAEAHNNLAAALQAQGNLAEAIEHYQQALRCKPDSAEIHGNLGHALLTAGRLDAAVGHCRRAVERKPDYAEAYCNLGNALQSQGRQDEAVDAYRQSLRLTPDDGVTAQNYLCALRYVPSATPQAMVDALADYQQRHAAPLQAQWCPHTNSRTVDRPLRLGFVSPRFAHGPVGAFLIRTLENLDRRQFPLLLYANGSTSDDMTERFRAVAAVWREVPSWTDTGLAEQIRADGVDILFDLAGHAPGNRLLVFARRPAPVQITWIDSVGTTGLAAIDYLLADRWTIPEPMVAHYTERVLRMPDGYICFDPSADAPQVGPLPAQRRGRVTFGSFNSPAKIHRQVVDLWSRILHRVPGSRLVMKYLGLDDLGAQRHYLQWFAACGVAPDRVEFRGASSGDSYLRQYGDIDLGLDPFPHGGGLTTCDALWMGVPVVTCPGPTFAGRQSLSHLSNIGLTETIADDLDDYVERAVKLADDLPHLAELRARLRTQMAGAALCDGPRFAANLMTLLRNVWHNWCAK